MAAAGVPEALVYRKFVSNDGLLVTPLQSRMIAVCWQAPIGEGGNRR
jgi:hypothetical protein